MTLAGRQHHQPSQVRFLKRTRSCSTRLLMCFGELSPFLKDVAGAEGKSECVLHWAEQLKGDPGATLPAAGEDVIRAKGGLMHEAVRCVIDAIDAATRYALPWPKHLHPALSSLDEPKLQYNFTTTGARRKANCQKLAIEMQEP